MLYNGFGASGPDANVAELVDALDLGSSGATRESSSLSIRTNQSTIAWPKRNSS